MKPIILRIRPRINKANGQINFSLPRKKLPRKFLEELDKFSKIKIKLGDFANE